MKQYDVAIIGCGPAGSTAANLLASAGFEVIGFERTIFPRFHVGESLLPADISIHQRLGICLSSAGFQPKPGAEFINEQTGEYANFPFRDALPSTPSMAWQVDRATFDELLAKRAAQQGAILRFDESVQHWSLYADFVELQTTKGTYRARYLMDASGQSAFLARTHKTLEPFHRFGRAAAIRRFKQLDPQIANELRQSGNIKILLLEDGWMWVIPLAGSELSVGVVKRQGKIDQELLDQNIRRSLILGRLTQGAKIQEMNVVGNFSYRNSRPIGSRFMCIGDAGCFLDPIFSSGVSLAMQGAVRAVDRLTLALYAKEEDEPELMQPWLQHMQGAYRCFESLIERFYHRRLVENLFFAKVPDPRLRSGLISVLAGDLWRKDNPFQQLLLGHQYFA